MGVTSILQRDGHKFKFSNLYDILYLPIFVQIRTFEVLRLGMRFKWVHIFVDIL